MEQGDGSLSWDDDEAELAPDECDGDGLGDGGPDGDDWDAADEGDAEEEEEW